MQLWRWCQFQAQEVTLIDTFKDVLYNSKISLNETFSIKSFSESSNIWCPYDEISSQSIKYCTFQSDFHDPIFIWLEESYLKRFHFHFILFVNSRSDPILPIIQYEAPQLPLLVFDEFHFSELEVLQWLHWLFHFT